MVNGFVRLCAVVAVAFAGLAVPAAATAKTADLPPVYLGPGDAKVSNIKDMALIRKSEFGFRYIAGQQDSHLTITIEDGAVVYRDTGTRKLGRIHKRCSAQPADQGIAVRCTIPPKFRESMFLEVWPRLGDDFVDGSTLPANIRLWVLADAGNDTVYGGAGDDFVNGAMGDDVIHGGGGDDWIRGGIGNDTIHGGDGNDHLVGGDGRDTLYGGAGNDRLYGGGGADILWGDEGADLLDGGGGSDVAHTDGRDKIRSCESVVAV